MADEPTSDGAEEPADAEAPKKKSGGLPKILVLVVLLAATVGGGALAFSQFATIDRAAQSFTGSDEPAEDAPIEYGEFMQIDGLVVNPAETGGSRYLMVSIGLESAEPATLEEITMKDIVIRDAIIALLSSKTVEVLADIGSRDAIKEEIRERINGILAEGQIERLYFTQFMLQ